MAGEFSESKLGRLLSFTNGRSSPDRTAGLQFPVYGSNGIIGYASQANASANSIIIGRVGSYCGSLYLSKQRCWVTDNAIRANALDGNDPRFLFYLLGTLSLNNWRAGSGQPLLNQDILSRIPAAVPDVDEQRAIAHILGTLDDKIELNRRMNEMLEAIARTIFKSWFVDFDPVRAKADGRDSDLPKHIADRFPHRLEDSELGEIPAGWRVGNVGGFAILSRNGINPGDFPDETFEHFSIPAFDEGQTPKRELGGAIKSNKYLIPPDAVLLSKLNPRIPRLWLPVVRDNPRAVCSTEFLVVSPRLEASREYIYGFLSSEAFADVFETLVTGTSGSHQRVKPEGLLSMNVVIPGKSVLQHFSKVVQPVLARMDRAREESQTLVALRDTLLPKLISGELRIPAVENIL